MFQTKVTERISSLLLTFYNDIGLRLINNAKRFLVLEKYLTKGKKKFGKLNVYLLKMSYLSIMLKFQHYLMLEQPKGGRDGTSNGSLGDHSTEC